MVTDQNGNQFNLIEKPILTSDGWTISGFYLGTEQADLFRLAVDEPEDNRPTAVYAEGGNDKVFGSMRTNLIYGGDGMDVLEGWGGNDLIYGGTDADTLFGQQDDDELYGDQGNDFLGGGEGNDKLFGGADNDFLSGGLGDDVLAGGTGSDKFLISEGQDSITDFNPYEGDKISFSNLSGQVLVYEKEGDVRIKPLYTDHLTIVENTTGLDVVKGIVDAGNAPIWALNFETPKSLSADLGSDYDESIQFVANMTTDSSSAI